MMENKDIDAAVGEAAEQSSRIHTVEEQPTLSSVGPDISNPEASSAAEHIASPKVKLLRDERAMQVGERKIPIGQYLAAIADLRRYGRDDDVELTETLTVELTAAEAEWLIVVAAESGQEQEQVLRNALVAEDEVAEVSGEGLLLGAQLVGDFAPEVVAAAQEAGFIINATGPSRLRFAPPLTVTEDDISSFGSAWASILERAQA